MIKRILIVLMVLACGVLMGHGPGVIMSPDSGTRGGLGPLYSAGSSANQVAVADADGCPSPYGSPCFTTIQAAINDVVADHPNGNYRVVYVAPGQYNEAITVDIGYGNCSVTTGTTCDETSDCPATESCTKNAEHLSLIGLGGPPNQLIGLLADSFGVMIEPVLTDDASASIGFDLNTNLDAGFAMENIRIHCDFTDTDDICVKMSNDDGNAEEIRIQDVVVDVEADQSNSRGVSIETYEGYHIFTRFDVLQQANVGTGGDAIHFDQPGADDVFGGNEWSYSYLSTFGVGSDIAYNTFNFQNIKKNDDKVGWQISPGNTLQAESESTLFTVNTDGIIHVDLTKNKVRANPIGRLMNTTGSGTEAVFRIDGDIYLPHEESTWGTLTPVGIVHFHGGGDVGETDEVDGIDLAVDDTAPEVNRFVASSGTPFANVEVGDVISVQGFPLVLGFFNTHNGIFTVSSVISDTAIEVDQDLGGLDVAAGSGRSIRLNNKETFFEGWTYNQSDAATGASPEASFYWYENGALESNQTDEAFAVVSPNCTGLGVNCFTDIQSACTFVETEMAASTVHGYILIYPGTYTNSSNPLSCEGESADEMLHVRGVGDISLFVDESAVVIKPAAAGGDTVLTSFSTWSNVEIQVDDAANSIGLHVQDDVDVDNPFGRVTARNLSCWIEDTGSANTNRQCISLDTNNTVFSQFLGEQVYVTIACSNDNCDTESAGIQVDMGNSGVFPTLVHIVDCYVVIPSTATDTDEVALFDFTSPPDITTIANCVFSAPDDDSSGGARILEVVEDASTTISLLSSKYQAGSDLGQVLALSGSAAGTINIDTIEAFPIPNVEDSTPGATTVNYNYRNMVTNHTSDATLSAYECDRNDIHTNLGAGGAVTLTLPPAQTGLQCQFAMNNASSNRICVAPGTGDRIIPLTSGVNQQIESDTTRGRNVVLRAIDGDFWISTPQLAVGWVDGGSGDSTCDGS